MAASFAQYCHAEEPPGQSLKNTPETRAAEKVKHHEPDFSAKKRMGQASFYAKQFSGKYVHRIIQGGVGHNLPQEAPQAFADAITEVDSY